MNRLLTPFRERLNGNDVCLLDLNRVYQIVGSHNIFYSCKFILYRERPGIYPVLLYNPNTHASSFGHRHDHLKIFYPEFIFLLYPTIWKLLVP